MAWAGGSGVWAHGGGGGAAAATGSVGGGGGAATCGSWAPQVAQNLPGTAT